MYTGVCLFVQMIFPTRELYNGCWLHQHRYQMKAFSVIQIGLSIQTWPSIAKKQRCTIVSCKFPNPAKHTTMQSRNRLQDKLQGLSICRAVFLNNLTLGVLLQGSGWSIENMWLAPDQHVFLSLRWNRKRWDQWSRRQGTDMKLGFVRLGSM